MAKTQEELDQLKTEFEALNHKLNELSDDELAEIAGGGIEDFHDWIKRGLEGIEKKIPVTPPVTPVNPVNR